MRLTQRVEEAKEQLKAECRKGFRGHMCANNLTYSCSSGDRDYVEYFTLKGLRNFIAFCEKVPPESVGLVDWKNNYWVEGQIDFATNARQWMMRHEENDWDDKGWIEAREYWSVDVLPRDFP